MEEELNQTEPEVPETSVPEAEPVAEEATEEKAE